MMVDDKDVSGYWYAKKNRRLINEETDKRRRKMLWLQIRWPKQTGFKNEPLQKQQWSKTMEMERREQRQGPRRETARHRKPMSGSLMFTTLLTICFVFIAVIVIVVCILCSESLIFSSKQSLNQPDSKPEYDPPEFPLVHRNSKLL